MAARSVTREISGELFWQMKRSSQAPWPRARSSRNGSLGGFDAGKAEGFAQRPLSSDECETE
jgi:hypothetical protein